MNRKSCKQRTASRGSSPPQWFGQWSQRSLLDLLTAAACSPGALHRLPSISYAIQEVIRLRPSGTDTVPAEHLKGILDAMLLRKPSLRSLEDFIPLNPSQSVRVTVRGRRYRLHPATLERPVAGIARILRVAEAVDDTLTELVGFGVADLLELVLSYVDSFVGICGPFWPTSVAEDLDAPPVVTAAEIEALHHVPSIKVIAERCTYPDRAKRALEWGIVGPQQFRFEPDGDSSFDRTIAVRLEPRVIWPLPPSLQMESFFKGAQELAARAVIASAAAKRKFHDISLRTIANCFRRCVWEPPEGIVERDDSKQLLVRVSFRYWLIIEIVSTLNPNASNDSASEAVDRLMDLQPGYRYLSVDGRIRCIPQDAHVVRLLVVSASAHLTLFGPPGIARMTLDDLEWISRTATDHDDLYLFARDLAQPPIMGRLFSFETINPWEVWRHNGCAFHRAGVPVAGMTLGAHEGAVEWQVAAEREEIEAKLFTLGLPELRTWSVVKIVERRLYVANRDSVEGWVISLGPRIIAVNSHNKRGVREPVDFLEHLAEALIWTLEHVEAQLFPVLGIRSLIFSFVLLGETSGPYSRCGGIDVRGCITIECCFSPSFDENAISQIEPHLRSAVLQGLQRIAMNNVATDAIDALRAALISQPRALAIEVTRTHQQLAQLSMPLLPHENLVSATSRALAERLRAMGIAPAEHIGVDAVKLETQVIYPFLKQSILEKFGRFDAKVLIQSIAYEVECASYWRAFRRESLKSSVRTIGVAFDPVERSIDLDREDSAIQRRLEFLIELALANHPTGKSHPDRVELRDLISIASMCIESGFRGEAAHYRLEPVATVVSDTYEVSSRPWGEMPLDWAEYQRCRNELGMAVIRDNSPSRAGVRSRQKMRADDALFSVVEDAMLSAYGFSTKCLVSVLRAITMLSPRGDLPIARISVTSLVSEIEAMLNYPKIQISATIGTLLLRQDDLQADDIEPWEFSKRRARITVRPLPLLSEEDVLVMPWFVEKTLSVYQRYLEDGRLPWPKNATHPIVDDALKKYRTARNTDLEDEVARQLESAGYKVAKRIKKAKVIGLSAIAGEIDAIVVNEERGVIWVLEVKDPEEVFSMAEIERSIRRFHGPGEWVDKLAKKLASVSQNPDGVARALGVQSRSEWLVRGAMVTREVVPAAFVRNVRFPFATIDDIVKMLSHAESS